MTKKKRLVRKSSSDSAELRCNRCGKLLKKMVPVCPYCGKHPKSSKLAFPNIRPDGLLKYFDWSCGKWIESRSQRRREYAALGASRDAVQRVSQKIHDRPQTPQTASQGTVRDTNERRTD